MPQKFAGLLFGSEGDQARARVVLALIQQSKGYAGIEHGVLACPVCGCLDLQTSRWCHANTGNPIPGDPPLDYEYCPQCDDTYKRPCSITVKLGRLVCVGFHEHGDECAAVGLVHRFADPLKPEAGRSVRS